MAGTNHRYHGYGLLTVLYDTRNNLLDFSDCDESLRRRVETYRKGLVETFTARREKREARDTRTANGEQPPDDDAWASLYKPVTYACFGRHDFATFFFIDDYEIASHVSEFQWASAQRVHVGHMLDQKVDGMLTGRRRIFQAARRHSCLGICRLKVSLLFTCGLGIAAYDLIHSMVGGIVNRLRSSGEIHYDVEVVFSELMGWHDLSLLVFGDSFEDIAKVVAAVRESSAQDLWEQPDKELDKQVAKHLVEERLEELHNVLDMPIDSDIREELSSDGSNTSVFLSTSTVLAYRLSDHQLLLNNKSLTPEDLPKDVVRLRKQWGRICPSLRLTLPPGAMSSILNKPAMRTSLKRMKPRGLANQSYRSEVSFVFGETDLVLRPSDFISSEEEPQGDELINHSSENSIEDVRCHPVNAVQACDYILNAMRFSAELHAPLPCSEAEPIGSNNTTVLDGKSFWTEVSVPVCCEHLPIREGARYEVRFIKAMQTNILAWLREGNMDEGKQREVSGTLCLKLPFLEALRKIVNLVRGTLDDPFAMEYMLEVIDYFNALSRYIKDCSKPQGKEKTIGNTVELSMQLAAALQVFERALSHRFSSGQRMTEMPEFAVEYRGWANRELTAMDGLLDHLVEHIVKLRPEAGSVVSAGALAVISPVPESHVLALTSTNSCVMGIISNVICLLRPCRWIDFFHEAGHLLPFRERLIDRLSGGWEKKHRLPRPFGSIGKPHDPESFSHFANLGEEIAADLFQFAFGFLLDWDLFVKAKLSGYGLNSRSYAPRSGRLDAEEDVVRELDDTCVVVWCVLWTCRDVLQSAVPGDPLDLSKQGFDKILRERAHFCPPLAKILNMEGEVKSPAWQSFMKIVSHDFNEACRAVSAELQGFWDQIKTNLRSEGILEAGKKVNCARICEEVSGILQGQVATDQGNHSGNILPSLAMKTYMNHLYGKLNGEYIFLKRTPHSSRPDFTGLETDSGTLPDTFLDRQRDSFFFASESVRCEYFRMRAALIGTLWHKKMIDAPYRFGPIPFGATEGVNMVMDEAGMF